MIRLRITQTFTGGLARRSLAAFASSWPSTPHRSLAALSARGLSWSTVLWGEDGSWFLARRRWLSSECCVSFKGRAHRLNHLLECWREISTTGSRIWPAAAALFKCPVLHWHGLGWRAPSCYELYWKKLNDYKIESGKPDKNQKIKLGKYRLIGK